MSETNIGINVKAGTVIIETEEGEILTPHLPPTPTKILEILVEAYPATVSRHRLELLLYGDDIESYPLPITIRVHMNKVREAVRLHGGYDVLGHRAHGWKIIRLAEKLDKLPT